MEIQLTDLIQTKSWQFPLNNVLFDKLMLFEQYKLKATTTNLDNTKTSITDFEALFMLIINSMKEQGVKFFSPGGSHKRRFIFWFNAHFWKTMQFEYDIKIVDKYFNMLYEIIRDNYEIIPPLVIENSCNEIIIESECLTELGKGFIQLFAPFNSFKGKIHFIDTNTNL